MSNRIKEIRISELLQEKDDLLKYYQRLSKNDDFKMAAYELHNGASSTRRFCNELKSIQGDFDDVINELEENLESILAREQEKS